MRLYRRQRRLPASNTHPLVKFLSHEMARQRATLSDVAERAGVCVKTISAWRGGDRAPKLADMEAVLNVLGYDLKAVPRSDE
jgi:transcriptional regulator with XRE-family HTH domain